MISAVLYNLAPNVGRDTFTVEHSGNVSGEAGRNPFGFGRILLGRGFSPTACMCFIWKFLLFRQIAESTGAKKQTGGKQFLIFSIRYFISTTQFSKRTVLT